MSERKKQVVKYQIDLFLHDQPAFRPLELSMVLNLSTSLLTGKLFFLCSFPSKTNSGGNC